MIIIKRSTPTVSRGITPHYDRKGKYSQKRIRESTILKSKVHLATSGSRVWPVTIFNTGLTKILVHVLLITNGSPFKKRFSNRPIKSPGSNFDSGYMNGNVIGSARSKDLKDPSHPLCFARLEDDMRHFRCHRNSSFLQCEFKSFYILPNIAHSGLYSPSTRSQTISGFI